MKHLFNTFSRIADFLVAPSSRISDGSEKLRSKALSVTLVVFVLLMFAGFLNGPAGVREFLGVILPGVFISYLIGRSRHYKIGGYTALFCIYLLVGLVLFNSDGVEHLYFISLAWMTLSLFFAGIWMTIHQVLIFTLLQIVLSIVLYRIYPYHVSVVFRGWFAHNLFFAVINISSQWILTKYQRALIDEKNLLKETVASQTGELKEGLAEREKLIHELFHRTKNNMHIISSLLTLQAVYAKDEKIDLLVDETKRRIFAMSSVHDLLYNDNNLNQVDLGRYVTSLVEEIKKQMCREDLVECRCVLDGVIITLDRAAPIGIVLHELLSDAYTRSFSSGSEKEVLLIFEIADEKNLRLSLNDCGLFFDAGFDLLRDGCFGLQLVVSLVEHQLGGAVSFGTHSTGSVDILIPVK